MRKKDDKTRTISFFSQKNQQVIIVSSAMAKKYALDMEKDDSVIKYEANIPLTDFAVVVDGKGLRRKLLETESVSDFMVVKQDGTKIVEIVDEQKLENKGLAANDWNCHGDIGRLPAPSIGRPLSSRKEKRHGNVLWG